MNNTPIPLGKIVAKAAKGKTRCGLVTVSTADLRLAADAIGGYIDANCLQFGKAIRALGGRRVANGHNTARYGFDKATIARIESEYQ